MIVLEYGGVITACYNPGFLGIWNQLVNVWIVPGTITEWAA